MRDDVWGLWICPQLGAQNVAAIDVTPRLGTRVTMYDLSGNPLGENWFSETTDFAESMISGPSELGWHYRFVGGVPDTLRVHAYQVPVDSFVLLSFTLPPGVSCAVNEAGWVTTQDLATLLATTDPAYTTDLDTCFVRIPWTDIGSFQAAGLSLPNIAWIGFSSTTDFTITTGCTGANPACQQVVSVLPPL